jgi:hypothetical protein
MCTVLYIPTAVGFQFASLRDENPMLTTSLAPSVVEWNQVDVLAPLVPMGRGTWMGVNALGNVVVLLNGGFKNHVRKDHYRHSRGEVVKAMLGAIHPRTHWDKVNLDEIEPFTLVVWQNRELMEWVWDGTTKHENKYPVDQFAIWSSATLYGSTAQRKRAKMFTDWMQTEPLVSAESIFDFFGQQVDTENGFLIKRENVETLSYSHLLLEPHRFAKILHRDLLSQQSHWAQLSFEAHG